MNNHDTIVKVDLMMMIDAFRSIIKSDSIGEGSLYQKHISVYKGDIPAVIAAVWN